MEPHRPSLVWQGCRATIGANTDDKPFIIYQYIEDRKDEQSVRTGATPIQYAETIQGSQENSRGVHHRENGTLDEGRKSQDAQDRIRWIRKCGKKVDGQETRNSHFMRRNCRLQENWGEGKLTAVQEKDRWRR